MRDDETIRRAEKEIDDTFAASRLVDIGYTQAVWTLLSVNEDAFLKHLYELPQEQLHAFADNRLNAITHPLRVCLVRCHDYGGDIRHELVDEHYQLAWEWLDAAKSYSQFCTIFPLWHRGKINIKITDGVLNFSDMPNAEKEYEAYNRLIRKEARPERIVPQPNDQLLNFLLSRTTIGADWFRVNFNPELASRLISFISPAMTARHTLPDNWQFGWFSLEEYRRIFLTIRALLFGWHTARCALANNGLPGLGYKSSVWVVTKEELSARLRRYTGIDVAVVNRVLDLITFGGAGIRHPDIAIQPLLDLRNGSFALAPFVWLNTNMERNLCVLLNQISEGKERYSRLSNEKERATREEVKKYLSTCNFSIKAGQVEGTDIDLAIIDRADKVCLCLELKWFIEPAEIREGDERARELAQGIAQAKKIRALFDGGDERLIEQLLDIDRDYLFFNAVASVNWIGHGDVQDSEVPIIKVWHLMRKIKCTGSLRNTVYWLRNRGYLPHQGEDYTIEPWRISCGKWSATWYGIKQATGEGTAISPKQR
jgi:hypothetical protein